MVELYKQFKQRFVFVITNSGNLSDENKDNCINRIKELFSLTDETDISNFLFTVFPDYKSEDDLSPRDKRLIKESIESLNKCLLKERDNKQIPKIPINFEIKN